jgi:hypothetical protein
MAVTDHISDTVDRVLELDRLAAPSPWEAVPYWFFGEGDEDFQISTGNGPREFFPKSDAELIAFYRSAAVELAMEVKRMRAIEKAWNEIEHWFEHSRLIARQLGPENPKFELDGMGIFFDAVRERAGVKPYVPTQEVMDAINEPLP